MLVHSTSSLIAASPRPRWLPALLLALLGAGLLAAERAESPEVFPCSCLTDECELVDVELVDDGYVPEPR